MGEVDPRVAAAADLIGRTGATALEVGYLHDDVPPEEAAWWAAARYRGARVIVEGKRSPGHALETLLAKLLNGARCRYCGREVTNRPSKAGRRCLYRREGESYVRGCIDTHDEATVPTEPWQRGGGDG